VQLIVDGYGQNVSYFDLVASQEARQNKKAVWKQLLTPNRTHRYDISVRLTGNQAQIIFKLNGEQKFEYAGPIADLKVRDLTEIGTTAQPALAVSDNVAEFLSCQVRVLSGEAKIGRAGDQSVATVPRDSPSPAEKSLQPNRWTELLPLVDLNHDLEMGYWLRGPNKSIRCESAALARLRLPVILKNCSYDLKVDFRIGDDHDNINLVIPVGDSHVEVVISNTVNFFTSIKGVRSSQNDLAVKRDLILPGRQHRYEVSVRLSGGQAKVEVAINGVKQFEYEGPPSDFSVPTSGPGSLVQATKVQPYLYVNETPVEYLSVQVRPQGGNAVLGREAPMLEPQSPQVEALKRTPLTKLTPTSVTSYKDSFAVNKGTRTPLINGEDCTEYLFAHAASVVKYNIPPKSRYFTAIAYSATSSSVKFIVRVDGKEMYSSQELPMSRVLVELPEGAKVLELECDPMGNIKFDQSCWCYPAFRQ
jgi:hypothetical protein